MTNSTYRCIGCRLSRPRPEYRRVGLGSVCSPECLAAALAGGKAAARQRARPVEGIPVETRTAVYDRDRHRCRYCGTTRYLHLHHINLRSHGVDHSAHNLITLCDTHHALVHQDTRHWQPILRAYIWRCCVEDWRTWLPQLERELA